MRFHPSKFSKSAKVLDTCDNTTRSKSKKLSHLSGRQKKEHFEVGTESSCLCKQLSAIFLINILATSMRWSACEKAPWQGIRWSDVRSRTMKSQRWVWHTDLSWFNTVGSLEERLGGLHSCSSRAWTRPAPDRQTQRNSRPHMGIRVPGDRYDTMCAITKTICLFDASLSQDVKC